MARHSDGRGVLQLRARRQVRADRCITRVLGAGMGRARVVNLPSWHRVQRGISASVHCILPEQTLVVRLCHAARVTLQTLGDPQDSQASASAEASQADGSAGKQPCTVRIRSAAQRQHLSGAGAGELATSQPKATLLQSPVCSQPYCSRKARGKSER